MADYGKYKAGPEYGPSIEESFFPGPTGTGAGIPIENYEGFKYPVGNEGWESFGLRQKTMEYPEEYGGVGRVPIAQSEKSVYFPDIMIHTPSIGQGWEAGLGESTPPPPYEFEGAYRQAHITGMPPPRQLSPEQARQATSLSLSDVPPPGGPSAEELLKEYLDMILQERDARERKTRAGMDLPLSASSGRMY